MIKKIGINYQSEDYKQGLKDGINVTCKHIQDTSHELKRNIFDLLGLLK